MFHRFQFEAGFCASLNQLPLYARMKLDIAGIKLSLNQWLAFALEERKVICHLPIENDEELMAFLEYVNFLCKTHHDSAAQTLPPMTPALWNTPRQIPQPVLDLSRESGQALSLDEWAGWQFHERYALYKTAVSKNEPEKFFAVLIELRQGKTKS